MGDTSMSKRWALTLALLMLLAGGSSATAQSPSPLKDVKKIVFLGDSITFSGQFIIDLEAYLRITNPKLDCEFLNLGLPSETVSGLSEPGHAGGAFPRPDLKERLDRVLKELKPDLVVACYGMNDGIYYPFEEARFAKYREGMTFLRAHCEAVGAKILHLTPPVFDPLPIKAQTLPAGLAEYRQPFEGYDEVLDRYSGWLLAQRSAGWDVVDVHGPMVEFLRTARVRTHDFHLAPDGVHINGQGHSIIAREILLHWGIPASERSNARSIAELIQLNPHGTEIIDLIREKQNLQRDAWLSLTGHKRPGISRGLPPAEAKLKAGEIDQKLRKLLSPGA